MYHLIHESTSAPRDWIDNASAEHRIGLIQTPQHDHFSFHTTTRSFLRMNLFHFGTLGRVVVTILLQLFLRTSISSTRVAHYRCLFRF
jgi:hypothetical protein